MPVSLADSLIHKADLEREVRLKHIAQMNEEIDKSIDFIDKCLLKEGHYDSTMTDPPYVKNKYQIDLMVEALRTRYEGKDWLIKTVEKSKHLYYYTIKPDNTKQELEEEKERKKHNFRVNLMICGICIAIIALLVASLYFLGPFGVAAWLGIVLLFARLVVELDN